MKLFNYFKKAVIYPSLFTLFFSIIYSILDNYKSDWHTAKSLLIMTITGAFIYSILMYILSLTIFLNKLKKLNKNLIWNILTWFLLPFGYILMVLIHDLKIRNRFAFGYGNDFIFLLIMTLPFVIGLSWTFMKYRQNISTLHTL